MHFKNNNKTDGIQFFKSFNESTANYPVSKSISIQGQKNMSLFDYGVI